MPTGRRHERRQDSMTADTPDASRLVKVKKMGFRVADTYGVAAPDRKAVTVVAGTTAIDMMAHESR